VAETASNESAVLDDLLREANSLRSDVSDGWQTGLDRYNGVHWDRPAKKGLKQFTLNRTQVAVLASVAVQTEQRPRIKLEPVESNDKPIVFLSQSGVRKLSAVPMLGVEFEAFQAAGLAELTDEQVGALLEIPSPVPDPQTMMPVSLFTDADFVMVNDETATKAIQQMLDIMLDRSDFDYKLVEQVTNKAIIGHQATLMQWNPQKREPQVINVHPMNCWIDPTATGIDDAEYFILAQVMSAEQATGLFPENAADIKQAASSGQINESEAVVVGGSLGAPYRDTDFERGMVVVWTLWRRNQSFPMTPDEAMAEGGVTQSEEPLLDDAGLPMLGPDGMPATQQVMMAEDGSLTDPEAENWPMRTGIRQQVFIKGKVLQDIECPYDEIPIAWNINLPRPFRPYGISLPERLEDVQQLLNRLWSIIHNHLKYNQSPQQYMPQSMLNALGDKAEGLHSHPGRIVPVPDDIWQMAGGKALFTENAATVPTVIFDLIQLATAEFKEISGHTDALTGNVPSGVESGRAIMALQGAARGTIGYMSLFTEKAVRQMVKLYVCMIRDYMSDQDWARGMSNFPVPVLQAIRSRTKELDFDIRVEVASGRGTSREIEKQEARVDYGTGLDTLQGTLERLGRPNAEQKAQQILMERAMGAMPMPGGAPTEAKPPGDKGDADGVNQTK